MQTIFEIAQASLSQARAKAITPANAQAITKAQRCSAPITKAYKAIYRSAPTEQRARVFGDYLLQSARGWHLTEAVANCFDFDKIEGHVPMRDFATLFDTAQNARKFCIGFTTYMVKDTLSKLFDKDFEPAEIIGIATDIVDLYQHWELCVVAKFFCNVARGEFGSIYNDGIYAYFAKAAKAFNKDYTDAKNDYFDKTKNL